MQIDYTRPEAVNPAALKAEQIGQILVRLSWPEVPDASMYQLWGAGIIGTGMTVPNGAAAIARADRKLGTLNVRPPVLSYRRLHRYAKLLVGVIPFDSHSLAFVLIAFLDATGTFFSALPTALRFSLTLLSLTRFLLIAEGVVHVLPVATLLGILVWHVLLRVLEAGFIADCTTAWSKGYARVLSDTTRPLGVREHSRSRQSRSTSTERNLKRR